MRVVVDTNIVFSAILSTETKIGDLLMNSTDVFDLYSGHYLQQEIHKHRNRLMKISNLTESEFEVSKNHIFSRLSFISEEQIPYAFWHEALPLVRDVDMDDISFVALNNYLQATLWTGDKRLLNHLRYNQGYNNCLSTADMFELRNELRKEKK